MKFCMITTYYPPFHFGGDGIYVQALSRALVANGHEVTVVHCADAYALRAAPTGPVEPEDSIQDGIRVRRLHSAWGWLSPLLTQQTGRPLLKERKLREILGADFDVVNFHNISLVGGPGVLALPAGRALKVWTLHEHWLLCSTHIFWKDQRQRCDKRECLRCCLKSGVPPQAWRATGLIESSLAHVDALIAPSQFTAGLYRPRVAPKPVHVLPLFSPLWPAGGQAQAVPTEPTVPGYFLFVGRVTTSKGLRPMLEQLARHPRLRLKVAGGGDLLATLQEEFQGSAHIEFLGPTGAAQLALLYAGATAVVLPSLAPETFGLTVVEAMAFGTPAVVHDAGGSREIVETAGAGFVFNHFDELPPLLYRLLDDAALRRRESAKARAAHAEHFTAELHLRRYMALLADVRAQRLSTVPAGLPA